MRFSKYQRWHKSKLFDDFVALMEKIDKANIRQLESARRMFSDYDCDNEDEGSVVTEMWDMLDNKINEKYRRE